MLQTTLSQGAVMQPYPPTHFVLELESIKIDLAPYRETLSEHGVDMTMLMEFVLYAWAAMIYCNYKISDGFFYNEVFDHVSAVLTDMKIISERDLSGDRLVVVAVEAAEVIFRHLGKSLEATLKIMPGVKLDNLFLINWIGFDPVIEVHYVSDPDSL